MHLLESLAAVNAAHTLVIRGNASAVPRKSILITSIGIAFGDNILKIITGMRKVIHSVLVECWRTLISTFIKGRLIVPAKHSGYGLRPLGNAVGCRLFNLGALRNGGQFRPGKI